MRNRLWCRLSWTIAVCITSLSVSSCSVAPRMDGGIVGTGNRTDCEAQAKNGTPGPNPEDCKRDDRR